MPADYTIRTRYEVEDASTASVRRMVQQQGQLSSSIDAAKRSMMMLGSAAAGLAAGGYGLSKAKQFLVDYNTAMEGAKIGMAAMVATSANLGKSLTGVEKFQRAMELAPQYVQQLKAAAAAGLGELDDYLGGFQLVLKPMLDAGGSVQDVIDITRLLVPVSKTLNYDMQFAAMDVQQMLMGVSKSLDRLPKYLGISNEEANKLARTSKGQLELVELIKQRLGEWDPAAQRFGKTLSAQVDTLGDSIKGLLGRLGEPLWRELGAIVSEIQQEIEAGQGGIDQWIRTTGKEIARWVRSGFEVAREVTRFVATHWERILTVAKQLLSTWVKIKAIQVGISLAQGGAAVVGAFRGAGGGPGGMAGLLGMAGVSNASGMASFLGSPLWKKNTDELGMLARRMQAGGSNMTYWLGGPGQQGELVRGLGGAFAALGKAVSVAAAAIAGWEIGKWLNATFGTDDLLARALAGATGAYAGPDEERERLRREGPAAQTLAAQKRLAWWLRTAGESDSANPQGLIRVGEQDRVLGPGDLAIMAGQLERRKQAYKGEDVRDWSVSMIQAIRSGAWAPKSEAEARQAFMALAGAASNPEAFGLRQGEFAMDEALAFARRHAPSLARTSEQVAGAGTKGSTVVNIHVQEVRIDARDADPDDIALVFSDYLVGAAEYQLQAHVSALGG